MAEARAAVSATKVTPPRPPNRLLVRARLVDRLEASIKAGRGFVLVSAPAGAGKSTLINGWLDGGQQQLGWLLFGSVSFANPTQRGQEAAAIQLGPRDEIHR